MSYKTIVKNSGDHVYVDLQIFNNTTDSIPAEINTQFTQAIIPKGSDYELSVIRMNIPSGSIPILDGWDDTEYSVSIINGGTFTQNLVFIPRFSDGTRKIYIIDHLIAILNAALTAANAASGLLTPAPFMRYDSATRLCILWAPATFYSNAALGPRLIFNGALFFNLFAQLDMEYNVTTNLCTMLIYNQGTNARTIGATAGFDMVQNRSTIGDIQELSGFVITTSMPISYEFKYAEGLSQQQSTQILTDYLVSRNNDSTTQLQYEYLPTAEYRMTDIFSDSPITQLNFKVFWFERLEVLNPLYVSSGRSFGMKLLFRKKGVVD